MTWRERERERERYDVLTVVLVEVVTGLGVSGGNSGVGEKAAQKNRWNTHPRTAQHFSSLR